MPAYVVEMVVASAEVIVVVEDEAVTNDRHFQSWCSPCSSVRAWWGAAWVARRRV